MSGMVSRVAAVALMAGMLISFTGFEASASESQAAVIKVSTQTAKPHAPRPVKFDWLAGGRGAAKIVLASEVRKTRQIGTGSWICSPAGFGKKSSCYAN